MIYSAFHVHRISVKAQRFTGMKNASEGALKLARHASFLAGYADRASDSKHQTSKDEFVLVV